MLETGTKYKFIVLIINHNITCVLFSLQRCDINSGDANAARSQWLRIYTEERGDLRVLTRRPQDRGPAKRPPWKVTLAATRVRFQRGTQPHSAW